MKRWNPETIQKAKAAAVAMAEFWDAMSAQEADHNKSYSGTLQVIESLAADLDIDPSTDQLSDKTVKETLETYLEAE